MDQATLKTLVDIFFVFSIVFGVVVILFSAWLFVDTRKNFHKRERMSEKKETLEETLQRLETIIKLKDLEIETLQQTAMMLERKRNLLLSIDHSCEAEDFIQVVYKSPFAVTSDFYCLECGELVSSVKLESRALTEDERESFQKKDEQILH